MKIPNVLFPYNGQFFTFEGFVRQIELAISGARSYENNVATTLSDKRRKQVIKLMAEQLQKLGE